MKLKNFHISHEELHDILRYINDEFTELIYDVESSDQSFLIFPDENSFIITFARLSDTFYDLPVLHYLEPVIFNLIQDVNSQLFSHDLYVSASDFGETDCYYELVISKLGHTPKYRERYSKTLENSSACATTSGMGSVSSPGVSSGSVSSSTSGSGDVTRTLLSKSKQKMGNPSEVSDLRFLKSVKIKRVKDI